MMNKVKLQPGDYVATADIKDEAEYRAIAQAFMEAGCKSDHWFKCMQDKFQWYPYIAWDYEGDIIGTTYAEKDDYVPKPCRQLTPAQILGSTQWVPEVGEECLFKKDWEGDAFTSSGLRLKDGEQVQVRGLFNNGNDLKMATIELENCACTCIMADCLRPLPTEEDRAVEDLRGIVWKSVGKEICTEGALAILDAGYRKQPPQPAEDMSDPANWRAGDVVECIGREHIFITKDKEYFVLAGLNDLGDITISDDDGDDQDYSARCFRFIRRP